MGALETDEVVAAEDTAAEVIGRATPAIKTDQIAMSQKRIERMRASVIDVQRIQYWARIGLFDLAVSDFPIVVSGV
jgi:hypothetical protein